MHYIGRATTAATLLLVLGACSGIDTQIDYDTAVDFSKYATYSWMTAHPSQTGDPRVDDNSILDDRVRRAVDDELASRSFEKRADGSDLLVAYLVTIDRRVEFREMYDRYDYSGWTTRTAYQYDVGTLILDLVDSHTKKLVWRGTAQAELRLSGTPEERDARVRQAVSLLLKDFPPGKAATDG